MGRVRQLSEVTTEGRPALASRWENQPKSLPLAQGLVTEHRSRSGWKSQGGETILYSELLPQLRRVTSVPTELRAPVSA